MASLYVNSGRNFFCFSVLLVALLLGLIIRWSYIREVASTRKGALRYGIIFDAGSTGTRVHIFHVLHNFSNSDQPFVLLKYDLYENEPGISTFAKFPHEAVEYLRPLLINASLHVPESHWRRTLLVLRATAGLRLLPNNVASSILSDIYSLFKEYNFMLPAEGSVGIMDGVDEGIFAWMTLNFIKGKLFNRSSPYLVESLKSPSNPLSAILDFGGGSTQLTFLPGKEETLISAPNGYLHDLLIKYPVMDKLSTKYSQLYSYSYLGLGLISARQAMLKESKNSSSANSSQLFLSPCFPANYTTKWIHCGKSWTVGSSISSVPQPQNASDENSFLQCYRSALSLLMKNSSSPFSEYAFRRLVHRPDELRDHELFAVSFIVTRAIEAGLIDGPTGGVLPVDQFFKAARQYCRSPSSEHPFMCMDLTYIAVLLHEGFGLPREKRIHIYKKINSLEISWPLGLFFDLLLRGF